MKLTWKKLSGKYCAGWFTMQTQVSHFRLGKTWLYEIKAGDMLLSHGNASTMQEAKSLAEVDFWAHFGRNRA